MNLSTGKSESFGNCEYKEHLNILRQLYFFSKLPLETVKVFAYLCSKEYYKPGDFLFRQGEDEGRAFYIISGTARLYRNMEGREQEIRDYGPEDFIGTMALLGNIPRLYSLKAFSNLSCLVMQRDKISRALQQYPELMPKVMRTVVERVNYWEEQFLMRHAQKDEKYMKGLGVSLI
ncbi:MAG: cyclic nucleotide-binding domain-containing protein [Desulfococcaceae bacterium]|jgi:CRP-like cAMP-binding protein|nr:cyclic nucleotide-binding domain-containing protein [Desulfococcaceae bacterium]